jgi:hypothetical protein
MDEKPLCIRDVSKESIDAVVTVWTKAVSLCHLFCHMGAARFSATMLPAI